MTMPSKCEYPMEQSILVKIGLNRIKMQYMNCQSQWVHSANTFVKPKTFKSEMQNLKHTRLQIYENKSLLRKIRDIKSFDVFLKSNLLK